MMFCYSQTLCFYFVPRFDVIYCNYDVRSQRFSFVIWITPISGPVWGCLFATFLLVAVLMALQTKNDKVKFYTAICHTAFDVYSIMARQEVAFVTSTILFSTLSFTSLIMLSIYEFYVTSELVVPDVPAKLETLAQLVTHGYKFHYMRNPQGSQNMTDILRDDFERMKITQYLDLRLVELEETNVIEITQKFQKSKPEFAWLLKAPNRAAEMFRKLVSDTWLKGGYICHLVENVGGRTPQFDEIQVSITYRVMSVLQRLREGGFEAMWRNWDEYSSNLMYQFLGNGTRSSEKHGDFVSFVNLLSFAIVVGVLFLFFLFLWGCELFWGRKLYKKVCRRGGRNLKIIVINSEPIVVEVTSVCGNEIVYKLNGNRKESSQRYLTSPGSN